jgi:alkylation response protein AidB-like acyl-CoA dehydrogenase
MDEVVVPPENLIGAPGQGFYQTVRPPARGG